MQEWEYKLLERERDVGWLGGIKKWSADMNDIISMLGTEGWELVTVVPRSSVASLYNNGVTTDELWVFKLPA